MIVVESKVYVIGVGLTRIARLYDKGLTDLFAEASLKALEDAGWPEVDAVVVGSMLPSIHNEQSSLASLLAQSLPYTRGKMAVGVEDADNSGLAAVIKGYSLIASGLAKTVLVAGVEKMTEYPSAMAIRALSQACNAQHELFHGATLISLQALLMRLYMNTYGIDRDTMSAWPVLMHSNASENPYAQLRFKVTKEQVASSMMVSDPIRLLDSSPIGDGAAAIVLAASDAAGSRNNAVEIAAVAQASDTVGIAYREDPLRLLAAEKAARTAYEKAGIKARDLDVVELHDTTTILGLLGLEALGLSPRGKAAVMVDEGEFSSKSKPSVNLSGGLKARGHPAGATGVYQAAEIALQLRGDYPGRRAPDPEMGLALGLGGLGSTASIIVMRR